MSQMGLFDERQPAPESGTTAGKIACHEAGHAVIARALGGEIRLATITPGSGYLGRVSFDWPDVWPEDARLRQLLVGVAGPLSGDFQQRGAAFMGPEVVQALLCDAECDEDGAGRAEWAAVCGELRGNGFRGNVYERARLIIRAGSIASELLCAYWPVVERLAAELEATKTMDGARAHAVMDPELQARARPEAVVTSGEWSYLRELAGLPAAPKSGSKKWKAAA